MNTVKATLTAALLNIMPLANQCGDLSTTNAEDNAPTEETTTPGTSSGSTTECSLVVRAEVRDESGACSTCNAGEYITLVGIVQNPCNEPLTYRSEKSCLVSEFFVYNTVATSSAQYPMTCLDDASEEVLAPGDLVTRTRPAGRLSNAPYELTIQFEDEARTVRTMSFTVQ